MVDFSFEKASIAQSRLEQYCTYSIVKFILPACKTNVGTGGKRRNTLRSRKSAAPSINNLKCIALRGISLDVNKKKKKRNAFTTETA